MSITNQFYVLNQVGFPSTRTTEDYKSSSYTQDFLEGYRFQLKDWKDNYDNDENSNSRINGKEHPTTTELQNEITKIETALTEKYGVSFA